MHDDVVDPTSPSGYNASALRQLLSEEYGDDAEEMLGLTRRSLKAFRTAGLGGAGQARPQARPLVSKVQPKV